MIENHQTLAKIIRDIEWANRRRPAAD